MEWLMVFYIFQIEGLGQVQVYFLQTAFSENLLLTGTVCTSTVIQWPCCLNVILVSDSVINLEVV